MIILEILIILFFIGLAILKIGTKNDWHQCGECEEAFETKRGLAVHRSRVHDTPYQCGRCERSFKNGHGLAIHKGRVHKD